MRPAAHDSSTPENFLSEATSDSTPTGVEGRPATLLRTRMRVPEVSLLLAGERMRRSAQGGGVPLRCRRGRQCARARCDLVAADATQANERLAGERTSGRSAVHRCAVVRVSQRHPCARRRAHRSASRAAARCTALRCAAALGRSRTFAAQIGSEPVERLKGDSKRCVLTVCVGPFSPLV